MMNSDKKGFGLVIATTIGLVLAIVAIGIFTALVIISDKQASLEASHREYTEEVLPTFGTIRIQNLDGVVFEYQGDHIQVYEKDGEINVIVNLPYEGDSCFKNKFQDRMSMDWDGIEETLMLQFVEYISPELSVESKAWNILVVLNRMLDEKYPNTISEVIQQELEQRGKSLDFLNSIEITQSDIDAMELVKIHRWDATGGSVIFQEVEE